MHHESGYAVDPLASGLDEHFKHVDEENLSCAECHFDNLNSPSHLNGIIDTGSPITNFVNFDPTYNPDGIWDVTILSCSSIDCHGGDKEKVVSWL